MRLTRGRYRLLQVVLYDQLVLMQQWNAGDCKRLNTKQKYKKRFIQNFPRKVSSNMLPLKSMGWKLDILNVNASGFNDELCW